MALQAWFNHVRQARFDKVRQGLDRGVPVNVRRAGLHGDENALFSLMDHTDTVVLDLLVERGIDLHGTNDRGMNALHQMAGMGNAIIVKALLVRGIAVNGVDRNGNAALHWAVNNRRTAVVQALLEYGADPELLDRDGFTPLELARHNGDAPTIACLEHRLLGTLPEAVAPDNARAPRPRL